MRQSGSLTLGAGDDEDGSSFVQLRVRSCLEREVAGMTFSIEAETPLAVVERWRPILVLVKITRVWCNYIVSWCSGSVSESRWRCMMNMAQGGGAMRGEGVRRRGAGTWLQGGKPRDNCSRRFTRNQCEMHCDG